MGNLAQSPVGIIVGLLLLVIVVGGLLYIVYSRTNAVEKTGYGSLIMLAIVCIMIPVFWIAENGNQAAAQQTQFDQSLVRAQKLYAANCSDQCFGIKNDKVVNPTYLGWSMDDFGGMTDDQVTRIISAGIYNPKAVIQPANPNALPRSDQYGGALSSNDVSDLFNLFRSTDAKYLAKQNLPTSDNGFKTLPDYLKNNNQTVYNNAVAFANNGQFGAPVDQSTRKTVDLSIVDKGAPDALCASTVACFTPINVQVKVGTEITWTNKSKVGHTVTAIAGQPTGSPQAAPQIFDSGAKTLIPSGGTFKYTVTEAAYTANPDHKVYYYCSVHPDMLAVLTIMP